MAQPATAPDRACANCVHAGPVRRKLTQPELFRECRIAPPRPQWPLVRTVDFCGAFQPAEAVAS